LYWLAEAATLVRSTITATIQAHRIDTAPLAAARSSAALTAGARSLIEWGLLTCDVAAVDDVFGSGHERRLVAREKQHHTAHFLGFADPRDRLARDRGRGESVATTSAPSAAKAAAWDAPIPRAAPVTSTTRSVNLSIGISRAPRRSAERFYSWV
jgi:hypothetical protein